LASGSPALGRHEAQIRFLRIRGGLMVLRFAVIGGVLLLLVSYGVIHP
jgi:hypothetical protein